MRQRHYPRDPATTLCGLHEVQRHLMDADVEDVTCLHCLRLLEGRARRLLARCQGARAAELGRRALVAPAGAGQPPPADHVATTGPEVA